MFGLRGEPPSAEADVVGVFCVILDIGNSYWLREEVGF